MASNGRFRVGFVGVGKLGRPIALRLLGAGHDLVVFDTDTAASLSFQGTAASVATSLSELASSCDIVCMCLPGPSEVEQVVLGPEGIGSTIRPGSLLIDHTTNSPPYLYPRRQEPEPGSTNWPARKGSSGTSILKKPTAAVSFHAEEER